MSHRWQGAPTGERPGNRSLAGRHLASLAGSSPRRVQTVKELGEFLGLGLAASLQHLVRGRAAVLPVTYIHPGHARLTCNSERLRSGEWQVSSARCLLREAPACLS